MQAHIYLLTLGFFFGTILLVFGMKYMASAYAARARHDSDTAYQVLAEKAVAAQAENQATLAAMKAELSKVSASLASVEQMLKQVE